MKLILFFLVLSTLLSCSSVKYRSVSSNTEVYVKGSTLYFIGNINNEVLPKFNAIVEKNKIDKLVISSGGGDIYAGMSIGTWVYDSNIDIEIIGLCASSCANYIFPAAKNKYIIGNSIVAWHGNYHGKLWDYQNSFPKEPKRLEIINKGVIDEIKFYKHIGIDEFLCRVGKLPPNLTRNFFTLSPSSLTVFGVDNVFYNQKVNEPAIYKDLIKIIDDKFVSIVDLNVDLNDITSMNKRFPINKDMLKPVSSFIK
jgi:hypothetical protein